MASKKQIEEVRSKPKEIRRKDPEVWGKEPYQNNFPEIGFRFS